MDHALVDLPDTEKKLADLFNKRQAEGWEFAGQVGQMSPGGYLKLAFKRPVPRNTPGAGMPGGAMGGFGGMPGMPGMGGGEGMPGPGMPGMGGMGGPPGQGLLPPGMGSAGPGAGGPPPGPGGAGLSPRGVGIREGGGGAPPAADTDVNIITLKNAAAADLAVALGQLFRGTDVTVIAEPSSNTLLVRASPAVLLEIAAVVAKLEQIGRPDSAKPSTSGKPGK